MMKKRMWLAGASLLAIVVGSEAANAVVFGFTGSGAEYVIPSTGWYDFRVAGAQGGLSGVGNGYNGAVVGGELFLGAGTILGITAGGQAEYGSSYRPLGEGTGGGGGGGTFVFNVVPKYSAALLFAAGGGGGFAFDGGGGGPGIGSGGSSTGYQRGGGAARYTSPPRFVGPNGPYYTPNANGFFGRRALPGAYSYFTFFEGVPGGQGQLLCGGSFGGSLNACREAGENGGFGGGGGSGYDNGGGGGGSPGGAGGSGSGDFGSYFSGGHGGYSYVTSLARDAFGITGGNSGAGYVSINFVAAPEPSTWAMMLAGFSLLSGMLVRRGKKPTRA
jgi:PEP-CTERM motif